MTSDGVPQDYFPGPLVALGLTLAGVLATAFATLFVVGLFGGTVSVASIGIGQALGLGAVASFAFQRVATAQRERLGLRGFAPSLVPILLMLLPLVVVLSELDNTIRALLPAVELPPGIEEIQAALESRSLMTTLETFIVIVGIAPVVEEWLFRGLVLQGLVGHLSRGRAVALTAALFAIVHLGPAPASPASLSPLVSSFALGLVLGALRLASGSVLAPILLSAGISAVGLTAVEAAEAFPIAGFNAPGAHTPMSVFLPSLFAVCWSLTLVVRDASQKPLVPPAPDAPPKSLP